MKKFLIVLTVVAMASFLLVGCTPTTNTAPVFTSTPDETAVVGVEYSYTPTATDADGDTVTYEVAGPTGMVISDGIITWTPATEVTENVVVTATDGTDPVTQSFTITVSAAPVVPVAVTGVTLDESTLALTVGDAAVTLVATVAPATATDKSVTWASSNETAAVVAAGVVTPLNAGISAITTTTVDGGFVATCVVTVSAAATVVPPVTPAQTDAPTIISVTDVADGYVNGTEQVTVSGYAADGSIVTLYINDEVVDTIIASREKGMKAVYGTFDFTIAEAELGKDGVKTLYATAKEAGLDVSDPSDTYTFTLDTVAPKITTATATSLPASTSEVIIVTFDEAVNTTASVATETTALPFANSALNYENWTVVGAALDGTAEVPTLDLGASTTEFAKVSDAVVEITYKVTTPISKIGTRTITVTSDIEDLAGNAIKGDSEKSCFILP